jgi:hypothetical protein
MQFSFFIEHLKMQVKITSSNDIYINLIDWIVKISFPPPQFNGKLCLERLSTWQGKYHKSLCSLLAWIFETKRQGK